MTNENGNANGRPPDMERILERVRAALHLSRNAANEHEAAAAVGAVQRMLFAYNLSMAEVENYAAKASGDNPADGITRTRVEYAEHRGRNKEWKRELCYTVAEYNFCKGLTTNTRATFVGRAHDIAVASAIYLWLIEQGERLAAEAWRDLDPNIKRRVHGMTFKYSFFGAFRTIVHSRMREQYEELTRSSAKSTALVALTDVAIDAFIKDKYPKMSNWQPADNNEFSPHGYLAGQKAGANASLARPPQIADHPRLPGGK